MEDVKKDLQVIAQLMDELQEKMQYGPDDLDERLGRKKPEVEVVKMEGKVPGMPGDLSGMSDDDGEEADDAMAKRGGGMSGDMDDDMDPDEELKQRLMKMRG